MDERLQQLIAQGEGISLEFKRCGNQPGSDVFETICSFANRQGGSILLGVLDDGSVEGVPESAAPAIERNLVNVTCNPSLFNVAPTIECERIPVGGDASDGRVVIRVWVPMGPSLYTFKGVVYDRRMDVDVKATGEAERAALILRKSAYYTEANVYPWVREDDLELELLADVRARIRSHSAGHPWLDLDDEGLFRAARLVTRDPSTGQRGFNLAAVMLLGREETILDVLPAYRTEVLVRRYDTDRYDDRLTCTKNLVRAYDELIGFCERWTPDTFVLEGVQRVSARGVIVRELVANSLTHREYSSPFMASIVIDRDGIRTENASRSLWSGPIDPERLSPTPKNPIIAHFFTQMGRTEELGSGTRKLWKYSRLYSGRDPELVEGDVFRAFVPVPDVAGAAPASQTAPGSGTVPAGQTAPAGRMTPAGMTAPATPKKTDPAEEVRTAVERLSATQGDFSTPEVAALVRSVGERMVRRYLVEMVEAGTLVVEGARRSTRYRKPSSGTPGNPVGLPSENQLGPR